MSKEKKIPRIDIGAKPSDVNYEHGEGCKLLTLRRLEGSGITAVLDGDAVVGWMRDSDFADYALALKIVSPEPDYSPLPVDLELREKIEALMEKEDLSAGKAFRKALNADADLRKRYNDAHNVKR
jgi:hypothetical protein